MTEATKKPKRDGDENEKVLVGLAMTRKDLARVDEAAKKLRLSRAAFIRMALFSAEVSVDHIPSDN
jgi:Ribbon-helix-helix protein, copG family